MDPQPEENLFHIERLVSTCTLDQFLDHIKEFLFVYIAPSMD